MHIKNMIQLYLLTNDTLIGKKIIVISSLNWLTVHIGDISVHQYHLIMWIVIWSYSLFSLFFNSEFHVLPSKLNHIL